MIRVVAKGAMARCDERDKNQRYSTTHIDANSLLELTGRMS